MTASPPWLADLAGAATRSWPGQLARPVPPEHARDSAVLVLFGPGPRGGQGDGPGQEPPGDAEILLTERAHTLRSHAGQMAFPGGRIDPGDDGPVGAALREAWEETGLDPGGVHVTAALPPLFIPHSGYRVTPVLAWWSVPSPVRVVDVAEVASVHRVPVRHLLDPAHRFRIRMPAGTLTPAFTWADLVVWGFTAGLLDSLFSLAGWERPWDTGRVEDLRAVVAR